MSSRVRSAAIALGVIFVLSAVGVAVGGGMISILVACIVGAGIWFVLEMQANNRGIKTASNPERAAALASPPPEGMAVLYLYREGFMGNQLGFDVVLDSQLVTQLKSPRFVRMIVGAGEHSVAVGPKGFAASQNKAGAISVLANADETIVVKVQVQRGITQNSIVLERELNPSTTLSKLALIPMVLPEQHIAPSA